jgi:hypothetical protein
VATAPVARAMAERRVPAATAPLQPRGEERCPRSRPLEPTGARRT